MVESVERSYLEDGETTTPTTFGKVVDNSFFKNTKSIRRFHNNGENCSNQLLQSHPNTARYEGYEAIMDGEEIGIRAFEDMITTLSPELFHLQQISFPDSTRQS